MSRFTVKPDYYSDSPVSDDPIVPGGLNLVRKLNIYYEDINVNYLRDKKGLVVFDDDVTKMQISNVLATPIGSEHFEPTYGSNVPYRLMDPISNITTYLLMNDTIGALGIWMGSRITVNRATSSVQPIQGDPDSEGYEIRLYYSLNRTRVINEYHAFLLR
ncbi:putative outer wedge baseplate protein and lysozyme protein [Rhizobium phage RHEph12]|nr:putative outer wedge baseplate protein and lysozyme protein [Rhizobium phage RHEph12]